MCGLVACLMPMLVATPQGQGRAAALTNLPAKTYVTDGNVYAVAATANAVYIGGTFGQVGPRTGPAVGIDASTGESTGIAEISGGHIYAVAPDGAGGVYIGG